MERLVIITGLSGSGKTLAADCFEDLGYFCVDNLPVTLIPRFCELIRHGSESIHQAALVIDAREGRFLEQFPDILRELRGGDVAVELLFFECSDEVLKRRFSESRRPHPIAPPGGTLEQGIALEREALKPLRDMADRIIDTSKRTSHELRAFLKSSFDVEVSPEELKLNIVSFGFKHGAPTEADLVFDVRFLPNPHFVDELRPLDGRTETIQNYLDESPLTGEFTERLRTFLDFLVPHYRTEGKSYLTIAIGCTGGKHRSVALAERLGRYYRAKDMPVSVSHRHLGRE